MTIIQFPARGKFLKAKKSDSPPQKTGRNIKTYLEVRDREYFFEEEVKAMIQVVFKRRWGHRDSTLILMGYRQLQRDYPDSPYIFVSERGDPMT